MSHLPSQEELLQIGLHSVLHFLILSPLSPSPKLLLGNPIEITIIEKKKARRTSCPARFLFSFFPDSPRHKEASSAPEGRAVAFV